MHSLSDSVRIIEYDKTTDMWNTATHATGAVFGAAALVMSIIKTADVNAREIMCAVVYCLSIIAVYLVSSVYHALPPGEKKRRARLLDHSTIPFLIAGTATPCALISLYRMNASSGIAVFCIGWFCVFFGVFAKIFFFEKLKAAVMVVYIAGGLVMMCFALPYLGKSGGVNIRAYCFLILGCALYLIGGLFCRLGIKNEKMHIIFHIFVLLGTVTQFIDIYYYVY